MEARRATDYQDVMDQADLVTTDGMPLVWMLRGPGHETPACMVRISPSGTARGRCRSGPPGGIFWRHAPASGSSGRTEQLRFPRLRIALCRGSAVSGAHAGRRPANHKTIQDSGTRIFFVGLGSPKQDRWMHAHKGRVQAAMLGVGAAFDFLAGAKPQRPAGCVERPGVGVPSGVRAAAFVAAVPSQIRNSSPWRWHSS